MKKLLALLLVVIVLTLSGCGEIEENTNTCAEYGGTYVLVGGYCEDTHSHNGTYYTQEEVDELLGEYEYYQLKFEELEQRISELETNLNYWHDELDDRFDNIEEDIDNTYNREQLPYVIYLYDVRVSIEELEQWIIDNPEATQDDINAIQLKIAGLRFIENNVENYIEELESEE